MDLLRRIMPRLNRKKSQAPITPGDSRWAAEFDTFKDALSRSAKDVSVWLDILNKPVETGYAEPLARIFAMQFAESPHELDSFLHKLIETRPLCRMRFLKALSDFFWENGPIDHALTPSELYLRDHQQLHLLFRAAEIHGMKGNDQQRVRYLEDVIACKAVSAVDWLVVAAALRRLQRWDESFRAYEAGLAVAPEDQNLWRSYAETAAVSGCAGAFVESVRKHQPDVDHIIAEHPPHSAVHFLKLLKRAGERAIYGRVLDLLIEKMAAKELEFAVDEAVAYISVATAMNEFDVRDRLCQGLIEQWRATKEEQQYSRAVFRLKLLRLFSLPLVFDTVINDEQFVRDFCEECQNLTLEAIELDDPVVDLGRLSPWVAFYTRAVPHLCPAATAALQALCVRVWPKLMWTAPHLGKWKGRSNRKIRVGFTCLEVMPMISGLMEKLDSTKFEKIFLRPSFPGAVGETARNWLARADRVVELPANSVYAVQKVIAQEELDVIVAGPSLPMSIYPMMARLAPLQMTIIEPNWCNGFSNVDYYISWASAEPANFKTYHANSVALLNNPPYWLEMPVQPKTSSVSVNDVLANAPAHKRIYVCPTSPIKLHPMFDEVLRTLLEKDPEGIVVFLRMEDAVGDSIQFRMKEALGALAQRVVFLPTLSPEGAHALLVAVDCVLDAYPLGGMSSSFIATAIGTPTVSLPAEIPFGKWMASIYDFIGVDGLTAQTPDQYAEIAYQLASNVEWRMSKAAEIQAKRSVLIESDAAATEFQDFLLHAIERHYQGRSPADFVRGQWRE